MARHPQAKPHLVEAPAARTNRTNLSELAYDRLEDMIVSCELAPGQFMSIQDLQERTQIGRTPIHQAVSRLAADTLITIRPRHGLQITPIDLDRERTLLLLRGDLERFVVRLATQQARGSHRNQLLHLINNLRAADHSMTIGSFNILDRRIDQLLIEAAGEAFLAHTLRPLHTIFRRIGYIYHRKVCPEEGLGRTVASHLAVLDAVAAGRVKEAAAASDRLMAWSEAMFDKLGRGVDPALFDINQEIRKAS